MQKHIRSVLDWVFLRALGALLVTLPISYYGQFVLAKPAKVKAIISQTGAYEKIVPSFVDQSASSMAGQYIDASQLPLTDPAIAAIFKQNISGADAKKYSESFIDQLYAFAESDQKKFEGSINYSGAKNSVVDNLAAYVDTTLRSKPGCTPQQTAILSQSFNAFTTPCVPAGSEPSSLAEQLKTQLNSGGSGISKDSASLGETTVGKALTKNQTIVQAGFSLLKIAFWINLLATGLVLAALAMLKTSKGMYVVTLIQTVLALVFFAGFNLLFFTKNPTNIFMAGNQIGKNVIVPISYGFAKTLAHIELVFAAAYAGIAIIVYVWAKLAKAKARAAAQATPTLGGQVVMSNPEQY